MLELCQLLVNGVFGGEVELDNREEIAFGLHIFFGVVVGGRQGVQFFDGNGVDFVELGDDQKDGTGD